MASTGAIMGWKGPDIETFVYRRSIMFQGEEVEDCQNIVIWEIRVEIIEYMFIVLFTI